MLQAEAQTRHEVLTSATSVNAEILEREGELGVVAAGAKADLLVVDGDPLEDLGRLEGQGRHLAVIMQDGRFVKNELA